jgi:translin
MVIMKKAGSGSYAIPQIENIEKRIMHLQERKDKVLEVSRDIIRISGKAITLMHAKRLREAYASIKKLRSLVKTLKMLEGGFEYYSLQAHQEYVEAYAFYIILKEQRLVSLKEMHVSEIPYLLGIMDLVGELKRETIEAIRSRESERANMYYNFMKSIYDSTRTMRFASSLVPEFRRKQDTARIQIESTASELLSLGH